jgi:hypothetical protein
VAPVAFEEQCGDASGRRSFITGGKPFRRRVKARRQNMSSLVVESRSMEEPGGLENFSLLGGPLHRLGQRLGLVRGTNSVALGLALGLFLWSILLALALIDGVGNRLFSLSAIAGDVRLLVVIPLFFLCESSLDPRLCTESRFWGRGQIGGHHRG